MLVSKCDMWVIPSGLSPCVDCHEKACQIFKVHNFCALHGARHPRWLPLRRAAAGTHATTRTLNNSMRRVRCTANNRTTSVTSSSSLQISSHAARLCACDPHPRMATYGSVKFRVPHRGLVGQLSVPSMLLFSLATPSFIPLPAGPFSL